MLEMTLQIPTVIGRVGSDEEGGWRAGQEGKEGSGLIDVGEVVEAEVCKYDKPRHANPSAVVTFFSRYSAGSSHVFVILLLTNNLRCTSLGDAREIIKNVASDFAPVWNTSWK